MESSGVPLILLRLDEVVILPVTLTDKGLETISIAADAMPAAILELPIVGLTIAISQNTKVQLVILELPFKLLTIFKPIRSDQLDIILPLPRK